MIRAYAETAVPIGSEFLRDRYHLSLSSATIRNAMAELEAQGLITHPHTSAGRVPTDMGYRYYADVLMQKQPLSAHEQSVLSELEQVKVEGTEEFLQLAARTVSDLSQAAGLVLAPQLIQGSFRHLEFIPMNRREVVGVLISSEGMVRHFLFQVEEPVEPEELVQWVQFINAELSGIPLIQMHDYLEQCLSQMDDHSPFYRRATETLPLRAFLNEEAVVILEGTRWVFEAPEFQNIQKTRNLVHALEDREGLVELLQRDLAADKVKLHIGSENRGTQLTDCTIASAPVRLRGGVLGAIGVLGPTRMDYPRVTALVGRVAQTVNRVFGAGRGENIGTAEKSPEAQ